MAVHRISIPKQSSKRELVGGSRGWTANLSRLLAGAPFHSLHMGLLACLFGFLCITIFFNFL